MRRRIAKKPNPPKADSAMKHVCVVQAVERPRACLLGTPVRHVLARTFVRNALANAREHRLRSSVRSDAAVFAAYCFKNFNAVSCA